MNESQGNGFGCGFLVAIIIIALIWGIGKNGKYEGQTAEYWFNEYDYCESQIYRYQSCVEDTIPTIGNYCAP